MEKEGIDYFNPAIVMALLTAFMSDVAFITLPFWFVPVIGLIILALVIGLHYFASFFVAFLIFPKITKESLLANIKGIAILNVKSALLLLAKIFLVIAMVLPLPLLTIAIIVAIILANKFAQLVAGIALVVFAPEVGVPAEAAEAIVAVKTTKATIETVEAGAEAAEVAEGAEVAETGVEAGKIGEGGEEALKGKPSEQLEPKAPEGKPSEQAEPEKPEVPKEALGEEPTEFEKLQKLLEETPQAEKKPKVEEDEENDEDEEEELPKAA